jgi:hypothetical protein
VEPARDSAPITERDSLLQKSKTGVGDYVNVTRLPELHVSHARTNNPAGFKFVKALLKPKQSGLALILKICTQFEPWPILRLSALKVFVGFPSPCRVILG